jgi:putative ABC transport system substrate-binding protein
MRKIVFYLALCSMLFSLCSSVNAQQSGKVARIGYVSSTGTATSDASFKALRDGLRDLGHIEGENIVFEYRGAEGKRDRIPGLVAELVQLNVDILFCPNLPAIDAAKQAAKTIPIVMVSNVDPVELGIVDSFARPGGEYHGVDSPVLGIEREKAGTA